MALNNPYITRIYDYEEQLLPHPDTESFHAHWELKGKGVSRVHIEIGCGSGIYLIHLARENPDEVFLGIELRLKRLVLAARKIKKEQLRNVLLIRERGEYLDDYYGSGCIDVLHINFPDKSGLLKNGVLRGPLRFGKSFATSASPLNHS